MKQPPTFAPIPLRAVGDDRLSKIHFRALAVVAVHDGLGKNGRGCFAGRKRMAEIVGCHNTNLSAALSDLERLGYITSEVSNSDGRCRVYRVIYDGRDSDVMANGKTVVSNVVPFDDHAPQTRNRLSSAGR